MPQSLISIALNIWLVLASLLFVIIVWRIFWGSSRIQMERNARIPFDNEGSEL